MNNLPDPSGYGEQAVRLPEVQFNSSTLEFFASKLGERLTQNVIVKNHVPGTILEGNWQITVHPNDPPHSTASHPWISIAPAQFFSNAIECVVTVDTSRLMSDSTYERQIILHANSAIKQHALTLIVQTALLDNYVRTLPYFSIFVLIVTSMTVSLCLTFAKELPGIWALTWVWSLSIAFAVAGVIAGASALALAVTFALVLVLAFALSLAIAGASAWALAWAVIGAMVLAGGIAWSIVKESLNRGFSRRYGILIALLSITLGISLGIWLKTGLSSLVIVSLVLATGLPLTAMILYPPLKQARYRANYKNSEQYLIKP